MAMTERRADPRVESPSGSSEPRGFRPASRRRARLAGGAALAALAIGGNVLVYSSLDDKTEVVQVIRNVRAGETVTSDDLRIVEVDVDPSVPVVESDDIGLVVNQYARVFIASGTLIVPQLVQSTPLVSAGAGVVAVEIRPTHVPFGLRERSRVMIVVVSDDDGVAPFVTTGRVVFRGADVDGVTGVFALSVEVAEDVAPTVASGDDVRIVLLDPAGDPAMEQAG